MRTFTTFHCVGHLGCKRNIVVSDWLPQGLTEELITSLSVRTVPQKGMADIITMFFSVIMLCFVLALVFSLFLYHYKKKNDKRNAVIKSYTDGPQEEEILNREESNEIHERIRNYITQPCVQEIHNSIQSSAEKFETHCQESSTDFLANPTIDRPLTERLPNIAKTLKLVGKLTKHTGPAGGALGVVVDLISTFGLVESSTELDKVFHQVAELRASVNEGFAQLRLSVEVQRFLVIVSRLQAKLEVFERNLESRGSVFYKRIGAMVNEYPPDLVISDLKQMHNIIAGKSTFDSTPLFIKLADSGSHFKGKEMDDFIAKLLLQFKSVMALQLGAVRMLRSFIVYTEQDAVFAADMKAIFEDLACQQSKHDPAKLYDWYFQFKLYGGTFTMSTVRWPNRYVYMQNAYGGNVRGYDGHPGDQGVFKVKPHKGDTFLISPCEWPNWNIYMKRDLVGNVTGYRGDPGRQGHWRFTIIDINERVFLVSTAKWPGWYMYMKDNSLSMNVRGWREDPGSQGHFIMTCASNDDVNNSS